MTDFFYFLRKARIRFSFVLVKTNTHVGLLWKQDGIQWAFGGSLGMEDILQGQVQRRDLFWKARKAVGWRASMPRECPAEMVMNSLDRLRLRRMRWHQRSCYGRKEIQGTWGLEGYASHSLPRATLYTPCCQKWVNLTGSLSPGIGGGRQLGLLITIPCEMVITVKLTPHITIFTHGKNIWEPISTHFKDII